MAKSYRIEPNPKLVKEAKVLIGKQSDNRWLYYEELHEKMNELFEYKEQFFQKAENEMMNPMCDTSASIILDVDIENAIYSIFDRMKEIFSTL